MHLNLVVLGYLAMVLWSCSLQEKNKKEENPRPNIIYILADDLGYGDLSALNTNSAIATTHMDRLVHEGMHFTDGHSASAVCTPTRYGIITGEYCWRSPLKSGVLWGYSPPLIEPSQVTIASFLQDHGYRTGVVGKWHLGLGWQKQNPELPIASFDWNYAFDSLVGSNVDYSKPVTGGPNQLGFEYSYIFPSSLDMTPYLYLENGKPTALPTSYTEGKTQEKDGRGVFWRAGEVTPDFDFERVLHHLVSKGIDFLKEPDQRPFFLYLPLTAPHTPWLPTTEVKAATQAGTYGDFVKLVDNQIGLILATLDEFQLTENTLVILSSDNGAHWTDADKDQYDHLANHQFRGMKADIYEGGHRVPFLFRWPTKIPAGATSDQLLSTTDIMATVAGVIKEKLPAEAAPDSYDLSEVLLGNAHEDLVRDHMIQHSLDGHFAIRAGDWKYTPGLGSGGFTDPKVVEAPANGAAGALYNLSTDIGETTNLVNDYPEMVNSLHQKLEEVTGQQF